MREAIDESTHVTQFRDRRQAVGLAGDANSSLVDAQRRPGRHVRLLRDVDRACSA